VDFDTDYNVHGNVCGVANKIIPNENINILQTAAGIFI